MKKSVFIIVFLVAASWFSFYYYTTLQKTEAKVLSLSVLDRVEKTGEIRCGYWNYEPYISKDPNTGKMSGLTVDYLEQTATRMGKKIIWEAEVGFDQILPSLTYNRIDAFCVPCSPNEDFRKNFDFVGSFGRLPYYLYIAKGRKMTKEEMQTARFAATDGYLTLPKTIEYFPKAMLSSLPQSSSSADVYNYLKYGKTDVVLNEHVSALNFMRNNPNVIERYEDTPLFITTMSFPIKKGDTRWGAFLQQMTDTTTPENKALFYGLIQKYNLTKDTLLPD